MDRALGLLLITGGIVTLASLAPAKAQERQPNPAFAPVEDDPELPRVLLIGDSISIGYTVPTRELLAGVANVHRIPVNGGPTTRGVEAIDEWLGGEPWPAGNASQPRFCRASCPG